MNSRFAFASFLLGYLAVFRDRPIPSETIAASLQTHPVVVRRMLGSLRRAGLVETRLGSGGGALLARPADRISLLDVYTAAEGADADLFAVGQLHPSARCGVGPVVQTVLEELLGEAAEAMRRRLAAVTVAQLVDEVKHRRGPCPQSGAPADE